MTEKKTLSGKTALITGASTGLGLHFAHILGNAGAQVILCARRANLLENSCRQLVKQGISAHSCLMDVTQESSIKKSIHEAWDLTGGINILVNNAGIASSTAALEQDYDNWNQVLQTNLNGVFLTARTLAKMMVEQKRTGSIINIASMLGVSVKPGLSAYCASKAAVIQLTRSLAIEWARYDIRVNALAPGYFKTDINREFLDSPMGKKMCAGIPQKRFGQLADLDQPLLLLAGEGSGYMTGSILTIDGGHSLMIP
ncbi:SDR family NAD(P)-dependent oxidoreductase [Aestuariispira insulae]|nr:SDR family NAD(P)-dependent oxidoreductase [Aestuariispira insulae]